MGDKKCSFAGNGNQSPFPIRTAPPTKAEGKKKEKGAERHKNRSHAEVRADVQAMIYRDSGGKYGRQRKKRQK